MGATLSFQSQVVSGFVGNAAAAYAFNLLGASLWPMPTVLYSNHPAGRTFAGEPVAPEAIRSMVQTFGANGLIGEVDQILSGYLGSGGQAGVVLEAVELAARNPSGVTYLCDPVLGDTAAGLYVSDAILEEVRDLLVPAADIISPNQFELGALTDLPVSSDPEVWEAAAALQALGPDVVVVTSVPGSEHGDQTIRTFLLEREKRWVLTTPRLRSPAHGAGDLMAAIFAARLKGGQPASQALSLAVSATYGAIVATGDRPDLALVAARHELAAPTTMFSAEATPPS